MPATFTQTRRVALPGMILELGTVAFTGTYAANGEIAVIPKPPGVTGDPIMVVLKGIAGFEYYWNPANSRIVVRTGAAAQAALTELANGAYPAGITGDTVRFITWWNRR